MHEGKSIRSVVGLLITRVPVIMFRRLQGVYSHESRETGLRHALRRVSFRAAEARKRPVLYWLSGLTCTEENFIVKAGGSASPRSWDSPSSSRIPARAPEDSGPKATTMISDWRRFLRGATQAPWSRGYGCIPMS